MCWAASINGLRLLHDCRAPSVSYTRVVLGPLHYGLVEIALGGNLRVRLDENDAIGGSVCQGDEIAGEDTCDEPDGKRSRCDDTKRYLHDGRSIACGLRNVRTRSGRTRLTKDARFWPGLGAEDGASESCRPNV